MALDVGFAYHDDHRSVPVAKVAVAVSTVSDGNDWKQKQIKIHGLISDSSLL